MIHSEKCINQKRVDRAELVLKYYANQLRGEMFDFVADIPDLIADLLHLMDSMGWNSEAILERARMHFECEKEHEDEECEVK